MGRVRRRLASVGSAGEEQAGDIARGTRRPRLGSLRAGPRIDAPDSDSLCARRIRSPERCSNWTSGRGRASRSMQPGSDDRPKQRPTARPRRRCTKSEVATGSSARSLYPAELVAASRSIPTSARRPALGPTAPLGDCRGLAASIDRVAQAPVGPARAKAQTGTSLNGDLGRENARTLPPSASRSVAGSTPERSSCGTTGRSSCTSSRASIARGACSPSPHRFRRVRLRPIRHGSRGRPQG